MRTAKQAQQPQLNSSYLEIGVTLCHIAGDSLYFPYSEAFGDGTLSVVR